MTVHPDPDLGHTCPGHCGRHVAPWLVTCSDCYRALPARLRADLAGTWGRDWPGHARALTDTLLWLASRRPGLTHRWEVLYARLEDDE